jgi:MerR family copper efflux transcriptional regulator
MLMPVRKSRTALTKTRDQGYHSIGKAAELAGITPKMIRHYEALELIPKARRTAGDYRVYSAADIHTLRFIGRARALGFSISEISTLLSLWRNQRRASGQVKRLALKHIADLDHKIAQLQSMRAALAELADHCHGDDRPECPILADLAGVSTSE